MPDRTFQEKVKGAGFSPLLLSRELVETPENPFELFRLSTDEFYLNESPEVAAYWAQGLKAILDQPKIARRLKARGKLYGQVHGIFDAPLKAEEIRTDRAFQREGLPKRLTGIAGLGAENKTFRRMRVGAGQFLSDFGLANAGQINRQQLDEDMRDMWILGRQDPVALATRMIGTFASFFLGTGAAVKGLSFIPKLRAGLALALANGLGGGGVTALEEAGKAVLQGEEFDPSRVVTEAAIFGLGGVPFKGTAIMSRAKAAVMTGGAALAIPPLFGKDVDMTRATAEVLFSGIIGNPRIRDINAKVPARDLAGKQKEVLAEVAESAEGLTKKEMSARVKVVDSTAKTDERVLEKVIGEGEADAPIARDGLVSKRKEVVAPDAPLANRFKDQKLQEILDQMRAMDEGDLFALRDILQGHKRTIVNNALVMRKNKKALDYSIFAGTPLIGRTGKALGVQLADPVELKSAQARSRLVPDIPARTDLLAKLRRAFQPELETEINQALTNVIVLENAAVPDPASIRAARARALELKTQAEDLLKGKSPLEIPDVETALGVAERLMDDMTPAELRNFGNDIPVELAPFEEEVRRLVGKRLTGLGTGPSVAEKETADLVNRLTSDGAVHFKEAPGMKVSDRAVDTLVTAQEKAMGKNLAGLRKLASEHNFTVEPVIEKASVTGYSLTHSGTEVVFSSLAKAQKYIESVGKGNLTTQQALAAFAQNKGIGVRHAGRGEYQTLNFVTGEQRIHKNLGDAAEHVKAQAPPPSTDLGSQAGVVVPGAGSVPPVGHEPRPALDWVSLSDMPGKTQQVLFTAKTVLERMQDAVKLPVFDKIWRPLMDGMNQRHAFQVPHVTALRRMFKEVRPKRWSVVQDLLIAGDKRPEVAANYGGINRGELRAVRGLERWYKELLELNDEGLQQFLTEAIPNVRRANGDPARAASDMWGFPASTKEILDDVFDGRVSLDNENALSFAQDLLLAIGRKRHLMGPLGDAEKVIRAMDATVEKAHASRRAGKGLDDKGLQAFLQARTFAKDFIDQVDNNVPAGAATIAKLLNEYASGLRKYAGVKGDVWTPKDVDRISMGLTSYFSGVAMSARPALAVRNVFQAFLNGPKVGFGVTMKAMAEAFTPEGRELVRKSGVVPVPSMYMLDEFTSVYPGIANSIIQLQRGGMFLYRGADGLNRATSYLAGRRSVREQMHLLRDGKWEDFLYHTGMINESKTFKRRIERLAKQLAPENQDLIVGKMGHEYGRHLAEQTQYIYNRANAPKAFQSVPGRLFGQFGMWPIGYAEYISRNLKGSTLRAGKGRNLKGSYSAKFVAKSIAMRLAFMGLGALTGIDTSTWNFAAPLAFEGGPYWQLLRDLNILTGGGHGYQARTAWAGIKRFFSPSILPFGGFGQDFQQATEEPDPLIALALLAGFNISTTKERQRERKQ